MTTVPILLGFNGSNYQITRSLRFRSSATAYLNRTPSVNSNPTTFTFSAWIKRGALGTSQAVFSDAATSFTTGLRFTAADQILFEIGNQSSASYQLTTSAVFRDPSAWYHIVAKISTSDATASNRVLIYVNGVLQTTTGTQPTQNFGTCFTTVYPWRMGDNSATTHAYLDGYLAEIYYIDGQALTPSSFGYFDLYGVWQPKKYNGTFGTNGFYLPFSNTTSTTTLVADSSGNGNNWTANNISLTAGTTYDSMIDSPTPYADGGTNRGNYCTLNPIAPNTAVAAPVLSNGNLTTSYSGGIKICVGTHSADYSGSWYYEAVATLSSSNIDGVGWTTSAATGQGGAWTDTNTLSLYAPNGQIYKNGWVSGGWATYTTGDVIGVAWSNGTISYYKNNVLVHSYSPSFSTSAVIYPCVQCFTASSSYSVTFGQRPFTYTPPSGYTSLNSYNLSPSAVPYGAPYMNAITYTGYGTLVPSGLGILTKRNALNQNVSKSLRFRSSANAYLSRTIGTPSTTTNTISVWVKRGSTISSAYNPILGCTNSNSLINFQLPTGALNDTIQYVDNNVSIIATNAVYRDPSAWVHVVFVWDTTNATSTERLRLYVDGVRMTSFNYANYPAQNTAQSLFTSGNTWQIGSRQFPGALYFDGYMAQFYYIDGQALTAASFGELNSDGVWVPKAYTGTYGTNGFYLPFTNTTSTTTLVADSSGNGNNWTPNNISLTAGTTYDSMIDSPTDYASAGNYAVLNPLYPQGATAVLSDGNLQSTTGSTGTKTKPSTIAVSSGKWYWEVTPTAASAGADYHVGIANFDFTTTAVLGSTSTEYTYAQNGQKGNNNVYVAYGATYTTNDIIGVALDLDNGTLTYYKNGVSQGLAYSGISGTYVAVAGDGSTAQTSTFVFNFGQRPFTYSAPSGYSTLNTYNITAPSKTWFSSANNSGNASATAYPDFVWIKARSSAQNHSLNDTLRGPTLNLISNNTNTESGMSTMFNVNKYGLTLGNDASVNSGSVTDVMWGWQGGNGVTSTNTNGTITSQVSASTTSGFSIVTYTGTGAAATIGHGLGVAPNLIFVKRRSGTAVDWLVYSSAVALNGSSWLVLNTTAAATAGSGQFNNTAPTSSVFSVGTDIGTNASGATYVAYCFAPVSGYSAFGKYTGNGSADGPFIYTGFRPRWIIGKRTNTTGVWWIYDTSRDTYNVVGNELIANASDAETAGNASFDILSNGFKLRTTGIGRNGSGDTFIYAAFAENPFNMSRAR